MKKTLFIGSTVLDVIVRLDHLPTLMEDINTDSVDMALGGCSYNASSVLDHLSLPYYHCSSCGTGFFADSVRRLLKEVDRVPMIEILDQDNGCCICLVNSQGERTFLCQHGAEYLFDVEWLKDIDQSELDYVYVCGLEIEDQNGEVLIEYLSQLQGPEIVYAPGARILSIQRERMEAILALHPILHLNDEEALSYSRCDSIEKAALNLAKQTQNTVIVTGGEKGAYLYDCGVGQWVSAEKTVIVDTIGAGDNHIGAWIAARKIGTSAKEALMFANKVAAKVVSSHGATMNSDQFKSLKIELEKLN